VKKILDLLISKLQLRYRGQITSKYEIGHWIEFICSQNQVLSIVEIGTWNGAGSSSLIAKSIQDRNSLKNVSVVGLEINNDMYKMAKNRLKKYSFFKVIHGRIVDEEDLDFLNLSKEEIIWVKNDISNMKSCQNVLELLPKAIDLLILDGGEFSTYSEFKKLENRLMKFIILDDIKLRKSRKILEEMVKSPTYNVVFISNERNGSALIIKI
jgi:hypothetical protein